MFINVPVDSVDVAPEWERAPLDAVKRLADYPVALIGDVQKRIGMMSSAIRPTGKPCKFYGTILPILSREGDNLAIHRALDDAKAGDVLVINAHSETSRSGFGDLLGEICLAKKVAGVVIDGAARDVEELEKMGLPVFARGINPAGPSKVGPGTVGYPVACGNVVCYPGDAIYGDRDGLIVVSKNNLEKFAVKIVEQDGFEDDLRKRIRASAV